MICPEQIKVPSLFHRVLNLWRGWRSLPLFVRLQGPLNKRRSLLRLRKRPPIGRCTDLTPGTQLSTNPSAGYCPAGKRHWVFPAEGGIDSSPAIYNGLIYVGCDDFYLYAVDERSGNMVWRTKLGGAIKSSPALDSGLVLVGCEDGKFYALDAASGKQVWMFECGDRISGGPTVAGGQVFFGCWG